MFYTLNAVCHIKASLNTNLEISNKGIFEIRFLRITYKINVFSVDMHFKLFTISKMILVWSGDIEFNADLLISIKIKKEECGLPQGSII